MTKALSDVQWTSRFPGNGTVLYQKRTKKISKRELIPGALRRSARFLSCGKSTKATKKL